jgi:hypothetical protein
MARESNELYPYRHNGGLENKGVYERVAEDITGSGLLRGRRRQRYSRDLRLMRVLKKKGGLGSSDPYCTADESVSCLELV